MFIVTPIVGVCNCFLFCSTLVYVHSRKLVALLSLASRCFVMAALLFLTVPWVCLWFVIMVFPDHTHLLF